MANQRIKVNVDALIECIRAARSKAQAERLGQLTRHPEVLAAYRANIVSALEKALAQAKKTAKWQTCHGGVQFGKVRVAMPFPEKHPFDGSSFDRDISLLEMAADETITISTNDRYARYL